MTDSDLSEVIRIPLLRGEVTVPPIVYEAASRFFAAYVMNEKVTNENEAAMLEKVVGQALELAITTERVIAESEKPAI